MSRFYYALERFRIAPDVGPEDSPFRLVSSVAGPSASDEVAAAWQGRILPDDAKDLWNASRTARLFEDADYGQWGLVLLDPHTSRQRTQAERSQRPQDFRDDDLVIGEFLGDQELLVLAPSDVGLRRILIALPLYARAEWFGVANDLVQFLLNYFDARGDKYWEISG